MPRKQTARMKTIGVADAVSHSQFEPKKNQGYQLPLHLWQDLHEEAGRRKRLGLPLATQNAIACAALVSWLDENKGGNQ